MKPFTEEIHSISAALEQFESISADLAADKTLEVATAALTQARAEFDRVAADQSGFNDETLTAEELVDRRIEARGEARRAVEVAEIRLQRAEAARANREAERESILYQPAQNMERILLEAAQMVAAKLKAGLVELLGEEFANGRDFHHAISSKTGPFRESALWFRKPMGTEQRAGLISGGLKLIRSANL